MIVGRRQGVDAEQWTLSSPSCGVQVC